MAVDLPELLLPDVGAWREWLGLHAASSPGVRLVLTRKGGSVTALTYDEALDEALCCGWIDGQTGRRDDASTLRRFTPRSPRSAWSLRNTGHVARLVEQGRMRPGGQAAVDAARADGRWAAAYAGQATIAVPDDLLAALAVTAAAAATWERLTSANRYAVLLRLGRVRPERRAARLDELVAMLARGQTFHPQRG